MVFYAKTPDENGYSQTVKEHCDAVAELAGLYAQSFGEKRAAEICGIFHDFGKYTERFQDVLKRKRTGIDHAVCGALLLSMSFSQHNKSINRIYAAIIEAINGHHDGLLSGRVISKYDMIFASDNNPQYINANKACAIAGKSEYDIAHAAFLADRPNAKIREKLDKPIYDGEVNSTIYNTQAMLFTRMLFSCLVDADYTASGGNSFSENVIQAQPLLTSLNEYMNELRAASNSNPRVNELRNILFDCCGNAGEKCDPGLYTLTAPTGMGKTMALLNFALRHCVAHPEKKRIIMVLPFLSLTEQTAKSYKDIIPEILEAHSQGKITEENREISEKWDAPFIITTSVNFFEALFAQQPTNCRKLHNISESIIIFDEAQSLPANLTGPTLIAVNELCKRYSCTTVFSTATQPDYSAIKDITWQPKEIFPDNPIYFEKLRRTEVTWNIKGKTDLSEIAREMSGINNVCAILNLRKHAKKLYEQLSALSNEGVYFISTDLCPAHRSDVIAEIKDRQKKGLPCKVVSTQCLEAGVDLDFDCVFRALAPLEAIIQAAGRCNRNGRMEKYGNVTVFEPDEPGNLYPEAWYGIASDVVKNMLAENNYVLDINNPDNITEYYSRLFREQRDKQSLVDAIQNKDYEKVTDEYKLISKAGYRVLVPYDVELYERLKAEALQNGINGAWLKEAAPITVSTFDKLTNNTLPVENLLFRKKGTSPAQPSDFYILSTGKEDLYSLKMGLQLKKPISDDFLF